MAGHPDPAVAVVNPVAGNPGGVRMRWHHPRTANPHPVSLPGPIPRLINVIWARRCNHRLRWRDGWGSFRDDLGRRRCRGYSGRWALHVNSAMNATRKRHQRQSQC